MVHVPVATVETVDPDTVHTCPVLEVNDTGSFEVAVADRVTCAWTCVSLGWSKVMVCVALVTVNECGTGVAGSQVSSPSWEAVMVQVPAVTVAAMEPETVHTRWVLEANET